MAATNTARHLLPEQQCLNKSAGRYISYGALLLYRELSMRILSLTLLAFLLTACFKSVVTDEEKKRLLSADDLISLGCKKVATADLEFETNGLKHLSKAIKVTYDGHDKCGFYLHIELTDIKISSMSKSIARQNNGAVLLGLSLTDIKFLHPKIPHKGLIGSYKEAYDQKGRYLGFVYTSDKNSKYMIAMIFFKEKKHQPVFLDLIKLIEIRNIEKDKKEPPHKPFFTDSYVQIINRSTNLPG